MSSLTRTIKRGISRSGQTAEERFKMAVSAVNFREKHHGERLAMPNPRNFKNMNRKGRKRAVKDYRKEQEKRERAEYLAAKEAAKTKAKKPSTLDRIKAAIARRKAQAK